MLIERIRGRQLSDVWPTMSEAQRFGLVKSVVQIETKMVNAKLSKYGSLYYRNDYPERLSPEESTVLCGSETEDVSRFVIGQVAERSFWVDEKGGVEIDRGPCTFYHEPSSQSFPARLQIKEDTY